MPATLPAPMSDPLVIAFTYLEIGLFLRRFVSSIRNTSGLVYNVFIQYPAVYGDDPCERMDSLQWANPTVLVTPESRLVQCFGTFE